MFDVMNQASNDSTDDGAFSSYTPPKTFYEIMQGAKAAFDEVPSEPSIFNIIDTTATVVEEVTDKAKETKAPKKEAPKKEETKEVTATANAFDLFSFCGFTFTENAQPVAKEESSAESAPKKTARKKKALEGQMSLFDLVA
jgi:hypothetical protein